MSLIDFLYEMGNLKRVRRSGWWIIGIDNPENVAEHSHRTAIIGYLLGKAEGIDADKVAVMCLFHDMHEARVNDLHKIGQRYINFAEAEDKAQNDQLKLLPDSVVQELKTLLEERDHDKTPEGVAARDADLLEVSLQAKEYVEQGFPEAVDWLNNAKKILKTETAKAWIKEIENTSPNNWWKKLKKIER